MSSATRRLLLVEEDSPTAVLLKDVLTAAGHEVIHATRGEIGFARALGGDFHAVLASATAPGLRAPEMARRLGKERPEMPVIVLARDSESDLGAEAVAAGAKVVLGRPPEAGELLFQVHRVALEPTPDTPLPGRPAPAPTPASAEPVIRIPGVVTPRAPVAAPAPGRPPAPVPRPPIAAPPVIESARLQIQPDSGAGAPRLAPMPGMLRPAVPPPAPPPAAALPRPAAPPAAAPVPLEMAEGPLEALFGDSQSILALRREVDRATGQAGPMVIEGPAGTGHLAIARHLQQRGPRATGPWVVVDCSAFSQTQLDTELFGHERGANAGADDRRRGACERAAHGTLVLDQIQSVDPGTQMRLLRCLQEGRIQRLGGHERIPIDIAVVGLAEVDLDAAVAAGLFRQDLLEHLGATRLRLPALADRPQDIPLLARHFVAKQGALLGLPKPVILQDALAELRRAAWPRNLEQLENVIRLALLRSREAPLSGPDVAEVLRSASAKASAEGGEPCREWVTATLLAVQRGEIQSAYDPLLRQMEQELFSQALRYAAGNIGQAARWIGIPEATFRERVRQLKLATDGPDASRDPGAAPIRARLPGAPPGPR